MADGAGEAGGGGAGEALWQVRVEDVQELPQEGARSQVSHNIHLPIINHHSAALHNAVLCTSHQNWHGRMLSYVVPALIVACVAAACVVAGLFAAKPSIKPSTRLLASLAAPCGGAVLFRVVSGSPSSTGWAVAAIGLVFVIFGYRLSPIGLTGGIACGKSAVTQRLRQHGVAVVDADVIARQVRILSAYGHCAAIVVFLITMHCQVVEVGQPAYRQIVEKFGPQVLTAPDGPIDRKALGALIFEDRNARRQLNAITHPYIVRRILAGVFWSGAVYGHRV